MSSNKVKNAEQQNKHKKLFWKRYICRQSPEKYKYAY